MSNINIDIVSNMLIPTPTPVTPVTPVTPTNTTYWQRLNTGLRWRGAWVDDVEYLQGDVAGHNVTVFEDFRHIWMSSPVIQD